MRRSGTWVVLLAASAAAATACSLDSSEDYAGRGASPGNGVGGASNNGGNGAPGGPLVTEPPEQEDDQSYRAPVVAGRWVWTANPDTGKVAVVDAQAFTVRLADAGAGPTYLAALPSHGDSSQTLVINVGSHDATLLQANATGPITAVGPVPLEPNANAWAVSNTGKFAIAWTDSHALTADATETFQDISVLDLRGDSPQATRLVVGFVPSRVFIDDAERQAYVVAKSGISVIDLASAAGPRVLREEAVSDDPLHEDVSTRDVSVLPDGSYALVRHEGSPVITLVELATGALSSITLSGAVTDLDLVADGKSALAVIRGGATVPPNNGAAGATNGEAGASSNEAGATSSEAGATSSEAGTAGASSSEAGASDNAAGSGTTSGGNGGTSGTAGTNGGSGGTSGNAGTSGNGGAAAVTESSLVILPLPGIFSDPSQFDTVSIDEVFGQVNIAPGGSSALLYTNAVQNSHVTVLETARGKSYLTHRTIDVRGYVHDVFPSPDGAYAIASLLAKDTGGKPGFAAVPVTSALPARIQTTDAAVFAVAMSDGPNARGIVTVSDGVANFAAYIVRMPELVIDPVKLPSRPLAGATGLVPDAGVAYIAQAHPEGRITFINLETGVPRTITGFEISAKVSDGR